VGYQSDSVDYSSSSLTQCYRVTRVMSEEMGNLVVKVDVKENVEEGLMMANTELLEAWISSGKANSVSGKANQVTRVSQTCLSYPKLSGSDQGYSGLITSRVRIG
jgi:hypothetical protein